MRDLDVLALAAAQGRILVTHDFRTMPRHVAEFLATGATSPGVFLVKQHTPLVGDRGSRADLDSVDAGGLEEPNRRGPASLTWPIVRHLARHQQLNLAAMILIVREALVHLDL